MIRPVTFSGGVCKSLGGAMLVALGLNGAWVELVAGADVRDDANPCPKRGVGKMCEVACDCANSENCIGDVCN